MGPFPPALAVLREQLYQAERRFPPPNYVNPEVRDWTASACLITLCLFTVLIVGARLIARFHIKRNSGVDDWLILVTMPLLLGQTIITVLALRIYGFQLHIYDLRPRDFITLRQTALAMEILYLATTTVTKISILTFYRRMSASALNPRFLSIVWFNIMFVASYGIISIFIILFTCSPVEAYWYRSSKAWVSAHKFKCREELVSIIVINTFSTLQDFIACILPMIMVRKMRLPIRQKIAICAVFALGLGTCALGCLRIWIANKHRRESKSPATYDATWAGQWAWTSTCAEANLGVLCASAPALRVFCRCLDRRDSQGEIRGFDWYHRMARSYSSSFGASSSGGSVMKKVMGGAKELRTWFKGDAGDET